jgi:hypothetical protein
METWMMYALGWSLTIGVYGFLQKIESESKINRNSFILYSNVWMIIYPLLYLLSTWGKIEFNMQIFLYALLINTIYVTVMKFRLKSLEYLDSSSYFINILTNIFLRNNQYQRIYLNIFRIYYFLFITRKEI